MAWQVRTEQPPVVLIFSPFGVALQVLNPVPHHNATYDAS